MAKNCPATTQEMSDALKTAAAIKGKKAGIYDFDAAKPDALPLCGNSTSDDWPWIQAALNAAVPTDFGKAATELDPVADRGLVVEIPSTVSVIRLSKSLVIPPGCNLTVRGQSPGIPLMIDGGTAPLFLAPNVVGSGYGSLTFENLTLLAGGLSIQGWLRGAVRVRRCTFVDVKMVGLDLRASLHDTRTTYAIDACSFQRCGRGVRFEPLDSKTPAALTCSGAIFEDCTGPEVSIGGSHVAVEGSSFTRHVASSAPFVLISSGSRHVRFRDCTFGRDGLVPADFVVLGAQDYDSVEGGVVSDTQLVRCDFGGATISTLPNGVPTPSSSQARSAVRTSVAVQGLQIRDCSFGPFLRVVHERAIERAITALTAASAPADLRAATAQNVLAMPFLETPESVPFAGAGAAWGPAGQGFDTLLEVPVEGRPEGAESWYESRNLLVSTEATGATGLNPKKWMWGSSGFDQEPMILALSQDARNGDFTILDSVGLSGANPSEMLVWSHAAGGLGVLVYSVWLKWKGGGAAPRITVELEIDRFKAGGPVRTTYLLRDEWRLFSVADCAAANAASAKVTVRIRVWDPGIRAKVGFRWPQLEFGRVPSPYSPSVGESLRAPRTMESFVVGPLVIDSAKAAPSLTAPVVDRSVGDGRLNFDPKVGGPDGWVVVQDGDGARRWRRYGKLGM